MVLSPKGDPAGVGLRGKGGPREFHEGESIILDIVT